MVGASAPIMLSNSTQVHLDIINQEELAMPTIHYFPKAEFTMGHDGNLRPFHQVHLGNGVTSPRFANIEEANNWARQRQTGYITVADYERQMDNQEKVRNATHDFLAAAMAPSEIHEAMRGAQGALDKRSINITVGTPLWGVLNECSPDVEERWLKNVVYSRFPHISIPRREFIMNRARKYLPDYELDITPVVRPGDDSLIESFWTGNVQVFVYRTQVRFQC